MKTLDNLLWLGGTEPIVHDYLRLYERKDMTLEQALIGMVFTLVEQKNMVTDNYIKHLQKCSTPYIHRK